MATIKAPLSNPKDVTYNTPSQVDIDTTSKSDLQLGWTPSANYAQALLQNAGSTNLFLRYDGTASTTVYHTKLTPGTQVDLTDTVGSSIALISDANDGIAVFTLASPDVLVATYPAQPPNNINGY